MHYTCIFLLKSQLFKNLKDISGIFRGVGLKSSASGINCWTCIDVYHCFDRCSWNTSAWNRNKTTAFVPASQFSIPSLDFPSALAVLGKADLIYISICIVYRSQFQAKWIVSFISKCIVFLSIFILSIISDMLEICD